MRREMIVVEKNETQRKVQAAGQPSAVETTFELRRDNGLRSGDDRATLVFLGEPVPEWKVGQALVVTVEVPS